MVRVPGFGNHAFGATFFASAAMAAVGAFAFQSALQSFSRTKIFVDSSRWLDVAQAKVEFAKEPVPDAVRPIEVRRVAFKKRRPIHRAERVADVAVAVAAAPQRELSSEEVLGMYRALRAEFQIAMGGMGAAPVETGLRAESNPGQEVSQVEVLKGSPVISAGTKNGSVEVPRKRLANREKAPAAAVVVPAIPFLTPIDEFYGTEIVPVLGGLELVQSELKFGLKEPRWPAGSRAATTEELSTQLGSPSLATQVLSGSPAVVATAVVSTQAKPVSRASVSTVDTRVVDYSGAAVQPKPEVAVRAFGDGQEIDAAEEVSITVGDSGWKWVGARDFVGAYVLRSDRRFGVPLISENELAFLYKKANSDSKQEETGLVWGDWIEGRSVQLSDHLDPPIFLDENFREVQEESGSDGETQGVRKYFFFVGVKPGAHLLYFGTNERGEFLGQGAVAVPVEASESTFVDAAQPTRREILRGRVLDGAAPLSDGLSGMSLKVLGTQIAKVETAADGSFAIPNVVRMGRHPLFLETRSSEGPVHRYVVENPKGNDLYWFNHEHLRELIAPVQHEVLPETALVVAAFPELVSRHEGHWLYPDVVDFKDSNRTVTYSLTHEGKPLAGAPLEKDSARMLSVGAGSGFMKIQLSANGLGQFWSQTIVTSPGVVNVVGPH